MKIAFDYLEEREKALFTERFKGPELVFCDGPLTPEKLQDAEDVDVLCVFLQSVVSAELIATLPQLKLIATRSTGFDHIALDAAREQGITVMNVPTYGARTVAEFTFALVLALSRNAHHAYDRLREEGTTDVKDYEGFDLFGKTLGIIGTGNIGKNVGRIAHGFGMQVCAFDVHPDETFGEEIGCAYKTLEEIVGEADVVSLHVPYIEATHHLINADVLKQFKKGSYLINTARGGVVDTKALLDALTSGHLAGAGLDVIEGERELQDELSLLSDDTHDINAFQQLIAAHALIDMPQVIVTPHIAFNTKEAKQEILETTMKSLEAFASGSVPPEVIVS